MANGFFQGGFAEGAQRADTLALQERGTALSERQQGFNEEQQLEKARVKALTDTAKLARDVIETSIKGGDTPQRIQQRITPFLDELRDLGANENQIQSIVQMTTTPAQRQPTAQEKAVEAARAKFAGEQEAQRLRGGPSISEIKAPKDFRVKLDERGQPVLDNTGRPVFEPLPGGPKDPALKPLAAEVSARMGQLQTGIDDIENIRDGAESFGSIGSPQNIKSVAEWVAGIGDANRLRIRTTSAMEGALRALTGAAAPETEVARLAGIWMPTPFDTQETRDLKVQLLSSSLVNMADTIQSGRRQIIPLTEVRERLKEAAKAIPKAESSADVGQVTGAPIRVETPEEARALPPGTQFITPDGRRMIR